MPNIGSIEELAASIFYTRIIVKPSIESTSYLRMFDDPVTILISSAIIDILKQLLTVLRVLRPYNFSYGGVSSSSLVFTSNHINYKYDGIHIKSDFTVKLDNIINGSITIPSGTGGDSNQSGKNPDHSTRLYQYSSLSKTRMEEVALKPHFVTKQFFDRNSLSSSESPSDLCPENQSYTVYQIDDIKNKNKDNPSHKLSQMPGSYYQIHPDDASKYQSSFNVYSFVVLLMSNFAFYGGVSEDEKIFQLWKSMWLPHEFTNVNVGIRKYHQQDFISSEDIEQFISNYSLRCDVDNLLWSSLKIYSP